MGNSIGSAPWVGTAEVWSCIPLMGLLNEGT